MLALRPVRVGLMIAGISNARSECAVQQVPYERLNFVLLGMLDRAAVPTELLPGQ
jgi:hypothetical protein